MSPTRIGLFSVGLDTYWPQFPGLKERLEGYLAQVEGNLAREGVEIVNAGLIDTPDKALKAGHFFRREDVDMIFLHAATYALSAVVLPVVRRAKVPGVVLNLTPERAMDYRNFNRSGDRTAMTGEWLAHCGPCATPEIANVFHRAGVPFHAVTGVLADDPTCWDEVGDWIAAARVADVMAHNRLGLMGHYYGGMLDVSTDLTRHCVTFGGHIEMIEVDELAALRRLASRSEIEERLADFAGQFEVEAGCDSRELERAARTSVALDRLALKHDLGSLAYYYEGAPSTENADAMSSIILGSSLLTARGIPVAGEYEVKNAQAMKILDAFGAGGSFTEFYGVDLDDDVVLMGHDGPGHPGIAEGRTRVRPLNVYHGKVGSGLSVEMSVRHGPVTFLSVVETSGLKFLVAEAESVPGPILEIGNTNSRYRFDIGARKFLNAWNAEGPAHHCAIGVGHLAQRIEKLGHLLGIPTVHIGTPSARNNS